MSRGEGAVLFVFVVIGALAFGSHLGRRLQQRLDQMERRVSELSDQQRAIGDLEQEMRLIRRWNRDLDNAIFEVGEQNQIASPPPNSGNEQVIGPVVPMFAVVVLLVLLIMSRNGGVRFVPLRVYFYCTWCRARLRSDKRDARTQANCPECHRTIRVP